MTESATKAKVKVLSELKIQLHTATSQENELDLDRCQDLLSSIDNELISGKSSAAHQMILIKVLEASAIGKSLTKSLKAFRRYRRSTVSADEVAKNSNGNILISPIIVKCEGLLNDLKKKVDEEAKGVRGKSASGKGGSNSGEEVSKKGFPSSVQEYRIRLVKQKKELYKDPPVLPNRVTRVEFEKASLPKRSKNGELIFEAKFKEFRPNQTPEEVLRAGAFGGTYFRSIVSSVTNATYNGNQVLKDTLPDKCYSGLDKKTMLTSQTYRQAINKFGVKCGGSLGMWESSGWISEIDPYGWFQWYCRFYQGRRSSDDERQVQRWAKSAGERGRFRSQLCNKCLKANTHADDATISPVIRQTLLHWGFTLTPELLQKHAKRKK